LCLAAQSERLCAWAHVPVCLTNVGLGYIWSTMLVDRAWSLPAITDKRGNPLKDNLAPELFIKFIAHDTRCHIIVFDLTLDIVQFCSANHLKNDNVMFDAPILLYSTGNHFQSVHPTNQDYFIHYARHLEFAQSNSNAENSVNSDVQKDLVLSTPQMASVDMVEKNSYECPSEINSFSLKDESFARDNQKIIGKSNDIAIGKSYPPYKIKEAIEGRRAVKKS